MLKLRVIQAAFGDCLILEFGTMKVPHYLLVDGGPSGTYGSHLSFELQEIAQSGGRLDLAVLSHVDNDHVLGLLDFFRAQQNARANHQPDVISIGGLWHNTFSQMVSPNTAIPDRLAAVVRRAAGDILMASSDSPVAGIREGDQLRRLAEGLHLAVNSGFPDQLVMAETAPRPVRLGNLKLTILGPNRTSLDRLRNEWRRWLEDAENRLDAGVALDSSIPNLSSIMFLAQYGQRKILLTGDGLATDLLESLAAAGLLDSTGLLKVDVLKLPHHGSVRNITPDFFQKVQAKAYVISANGMYGNPELDTLQWIVDAAHARSKKIKMIITNRTNTVDQLLNLRPPADFGYQLIVLSNQQHSIRI